LETKNAGTERFFDPESAIGGDATDIDRSKLGSKHEYMARDPAVVSQDTNVKREVKGDTQ